MSHNSTTTFYRRIHFLAQTGRLLVISGAAGALIGLLLVTEAIVTWSVVVLGVGLAMLFFRDSFRPKITPTTAGAERENPIVQWVIGAVVIGVTVLGVAIGRVGHRLFYIAAAVIVASIALGSISAAFARKRARSIKSDLEHPNE